MRKNERFIVIDTETANTIEEPLTYDVGFFVMNRKGEIFEEKSLVVYDIYAKEKDLMKTAYYADKLPKYEEKLKTGERQMVKFFTIKMMIRDLMEKHNTNTVYAYNMSFDKRALNNTEKYITDGKYKWFFPKGTDFRCIWNMACQVLLARPSYINFALENGFVSDADNILTNAECCYRYITKNIDFEEEHQGLDDVRIEAEILKACFAQHKKMDTSPSACCWRIVQKKRKEMGV